LRDILAESDSRRIFYFLCINLVSDFEKIIINEFRFYIFIIDVYIC